MTLDSKEAEKNYLRRSGSIAWEQSKPFSPPGTDTLRESVRLMHDFAVAVNALDAASGQTVLDLGSGSGWTSEWLRRLNLRVVSLDIAFDMLKVAQGRPGQTGIGLVTADVEALPFRSGVFDRALCLNALHHVPHPAAALREIARVLTDDGRLVLVEPGLGHAENATSRAAMNDFGVLEQDLEATVLMRHCSDAGFSRVSVRPLSYMTGELELSLDELSRWRRWTTTKRPLRAFEKIARAVLELTGRRKEGLLLEDALSMTSTRILMRHLQEQSVVVAGKGTPPSGSREYRAAINLGSPAPQTHGGLVTLTLRIRNVGNVTWSPTAAKGAVQVGGQVLDGAKRLTDRDYCRIPLPHDIEPGRDCVVRVEVKAPQAGGRHLKFDLVAEGITWFEQEGSDPLVIAIPGG